MSVRTGPSGTIYADTTIPGTAAVAMTPFKAAGNSVDLILVTTTGGCVSLTFTAEVSVDGGTTYADVIDRDSAWSMATTVPTAAGTYRIPMEGLALVPGDYCRLSYTANTALGKLKVDYLNWENPKGGGAEVSVGDVVIDVDAIHISTDIMDDWDATQGGTLTDDGCMQMMESKTIDGTALPNAVTEGKEVRAAATLYGGTISTVTNLTGQYALATMDDKTRAGYVQITDGSNEADVIATILSLKTDTSSVAGTVTNVNAGDVGNGVQRVCIATDDVNLAAINASFGSVGADADVDGVVHSQLRYIGENLSSLMTVVQDCEDKDNWAAVSDAQNLADDTLHVTGNVSVEWDKGGAGSANIISGIDDTIASTDLSAYSSSDYITACFYIPDVTNVVAAHIQIGTDNANYTEWEWVVADLANGWNLVTSRLVDYTGITGTGMQQAAVTYVQANLEFGAAGNSLDDMKVDHIAFVTSESLKPSLDTGAVNEMTTRTTIATDDPQYGVVGAAASLTGGVHAQLRSIGTAVEIMDDWDDGSDHCQVDIAAQTLTAVGVSKDAAVNASDNALYVAITDQARMASVGNGTTKVLHAGIHDGELLAAVKANSALADDLDGVNGLVTASVIHGYVDDATTRPVLIDATGHPMVDVAVQSLTALKVSKDAAANATANRIFTAANVDQIAGSGITVSRGSAAGAGTQRVVEALDRTVVHSTGTAAINTTTAFATKNFDLKSVTLHLDAALAAGETVYITLDATDGANYDAVLREYDLGTAGGTSFTYAPTVPVPCEVGDEIVVTMANSLTRTYGLRIVADVR